MTADGEVDWDAKLDELQHTAAKAYCDNYPSTPRGYTPTPDEVIGEYDWVPRVFDILRALPKPDASLALAEQMRKVCGAGQMDAQDVMLAGSGDVGNGLLSAKQLEANVIEKVDDWEGTGATSFRNFFADVPAVIDNQVTAAQFLAAVAEANALLLKCARTDAERIVEKTITALEALDDGVSLATILTVVGAVIAIWGSAPALVAGGFVALSGGFEIIKGVSDSFEAISGDNAKGEGRQQISGDTVPEVLRNMVDAVGRVQDKLIEGENLLCGVVERNTAHMRLFRGQYAASAPNAFTKPTDFDEFKPDD